MDGLSKRIAHAATAAVTEVAALIKAEGRSELAGFSPKFANAMSARVFPSQGDSLHPAAVVGLKFKYASVFEDGATISGHMWLPIEANLPLQARGKRWTPRDFVNNIGPLRSTRHAGKPLLLGQVRVGKSGGVLALPGKRGNRRFSKTAKQWVPVFVGVTSVTDPSKYNITAIIEKYAGQLGEFYHKNWDDF
jgi:hypothetical protein